MQHATALVRTVFRGVPWRPLTAAAGKHGYLDDKAALAAATSCGTVFWRPFALARLGLTGSPSRGITAELGGHKCEKGTR